MKRYSTDSIVVIMVCISAPRQSIIASIYDAITLNRNIHAHRTPFRATGHKIATLFFSTAEMIGIIGRTSSHPMPYINCMNAIISFISTLFRILIRTGVSARSPRNVKCDSIIRINIHSSSHTSHTCQHARSHKQRHKLFHKMYLLRFFFRSFSLCYPLSCGILLVILAKRIAFSAMCAFPGFVCRDHFSYPLFSQPIGITSFLCVNSKLPIFCRKN